MTIRSTTARAAETACWAVAITLTALYFGARAYGEIERRQAISTFAEAQALALVDIGPVGASRAADTMDSNPLPEALLRIDRVALEVPVYGDTSERNLNRGAGLVPGTAGPDSDGNIAIAAHRDGYFRALENVAVGDLVELESLARRRTYRITELAIVAPTDIWPLHETAVPAITLVTCHPFNFVGSAPRRFIVRAIAVESDLS